jgi:hypothetical protein
MRGDDGVPAALETMSRRGRCDYCDRQAVCSNGNGRTCLRHVPKPWLGGRYLAYLCGDVTVAASQLVGAAHLTENLERLSSELNRGTQLSDV